MHEHEVLEHVPLGLDKESKLFLLFASSYNGFICLAAWLVRDQKTG